MPLRAHVSERSAELRPEDRRGAFAWPEIQDYGIIGDCRSAALVSRYGSIDWLCWPRFDAPSIFAALLDRERGGYWRISPVGPAASKHQYVPDSNVVETHFSNPSGSAILTDMMPGASNAFYHNDFLPDHEILRKVTCDSGELEFEIEFFPVADYGKTKVQIRELESWDFDLPWAGAHIGCGAAQLFRLLTKVLGPVSSSVAVRVCASRFPIRKRPLQCCVRWIFRSTARIDHAVGAWQQWGRRANYDGAYRDEVIRSALALKLLTYAPSGAIIAAPTTSLPERIGGRLELGLSLLLVARCILHNPCIARTGLLGRSRGFSRLDATSNAANSAQVENSLFPLWRQSSGGTRTGILKRIPRISPSAHRECRTRSTSARRLWRSDRRGSAIRIPWRASRP